MLDIIPMYSGSGFTSAEEPPPPGPAIDPLHSSVIFLAHMNGTDESTSFIDEIGHTIQTFGGAQIDTVVSKFGGASGQFDGTSAYLIPLFAFQDIQLTQADFCIECWLFPTSLAGTQVIIATRDGSNITFNGWEFRIDTGGQLVFASANGSLSSPPAAILAGIWQHVAVVRQGTVLTLYINGISVDSDTFTFTDATQGNVTIGRQNDSSIPHNYYSGYIDDVRITKATPRYTTNFIPPTSQHPDIGTGDQYWNNVSLLLHMEGLEANNVFVDEKGHAISVAGSWFTVSTQFKFGHRSANNASSYLAYLYTPDHVDFDFGSGDFTIETWLRFTTLPANDGATVATIVNKWQGPGNRSFFLSVFHVSGQHTIQFAYSLDGTAYLSIFEVWPGIAVNQWYHFAVVRSGNTLLFFIDGVQLGTTQAITGTLFDSAWELQIGGTNLALNYALVGYLDDFRITKGIARYTANFAVPDTTFYNYLPPA